MREGGSGGVRGDGSMGGLACKGAKLCPERQPQPFLQCSIPQAYTMYCSHLLGLLDRSCGCLRRIAVHCLLAQTGHLLQRLRAGQNRFNTSELTTTKRAMSCRLYTF